MRRLEGAELAAYDLIPAAVAETVRVITVPVLPPGASGMTIGRLVFLRSDVDRSGGRELLAHELVHVHQYAQIGVVRFLWRYLRDYLRLLGRLRSHRAAYLAIPTEAQAREAAAAWKHRISLPSE